jgi:putative hemolysin
MNSREFLRFTLEKLGINYTVDSGDSNQIPKQGPVIVVANHPFGAIEGVVLAELLLQHRNDVKILANEFLHRIDELSELFIGVDVFENDSSVKSNIHGVKQALKHLGNNGLLLVFPAGEVSSFQLKNRKVQDRQWNRIIAMLVRKTGASTSPIFIEGHNSKLFQLAGLLHPRLRTLMLPREMLNKRKQLIKLHIGESIPYSELNSLTSDEDFTHYLRLNTYLLNNLVKNKTDIKNNRLMENISLPINKDKLQEDIDSLIKDMTWSSKLVHPGWCS